MLSVAQPAKCALIDHPTDAAPGVPRSPPRRAVPGPGSAADLRPACRPSPETAGVPVASDPWSPSMRSSASARRRPIRHPQWTGRRPSAPSVWLCPPTTSGSSRQDWEAVHAAVRTVAGARGSGQLRTLNALLEQWNELVHEVEEGYGWSAPELLNDLECRTALAQIWRLLPPRVRAIRQPELDEIDRRFHATTVGWPGRDDQEGQWWLRRAAAP